jgi:asparagine synthetase B (glutamine-hydrolysing)
MDAEKNRGKVTALVFKFIGILKQFVVLFRELFEDGRLLYNTLDKAKELEREAKLKAAGVSIADDELKTQLAKEKYEKENLGQKWDNLNPDDKNTKMEDITKEDLKQAKRDAEDKAFDALVEEQQKDAEKKSKEPGAYWSGGSEKL